MPERGTNNMLEHRENTEIRGDRSRRLSSSGTKYENLNLGLRVFTFLDLLKYQG